MQLYIHCFCMFHITPCTLLSKTSDLQSVFICTPNKSSQYLDLLFRVFPFWANLIKWVSKVRGLLSVTSKYLRLYFNLLNCYQITLTCLPVTKERDVRDLPECTDYAKIISESGCKDKFLGMSVLKFYKRCANIWQLLLSIILLDNI